jgi:hypothetical protein
LRGFLFAHARIAYRSSGKSRSHRRCLIRKFDHFLGRFYRRCGFDVSTADYLPETHKGVSVQNSTPILMSSSQIRKRVLATLALLAIVAPTVANAGNDKHAPDLVDCEDLQVPVGNKLSSSLYAEGVQIYRWNGTNWTFVAPEAVLYPNAHGNGVVGIHYAGPTWESISGSKVVGTVLHRCTPDPDAIPWLLLKAVSSEGPGIFKRVTYIQRVNTVGGLAPSAPGDFVGEEARVPYTTEYYFYRSSGKPE